MIDKNEVIGKCADIFIKLLNDVLEKQQPDNRLPPPTGNRSSKTGNAKQPKGKTAKPVTKKASKATDDAKDGNELLEMYAMYFYNSRDERYVVIRKGSIIFF